MGCKITAKKQWCCGYILALSTRKTRTITLSSSVIMPKSPPPLCLRQAYWESGSGFVWFCHILGYGWYPALGSVTASVLTSWLSWVTEGRHHGCHSADSELFLVQLYTASVFWAPWRPVEGQGSDHVSAFPPESDPKIEDVPEAGLAPQNTLNKFSWYHSWPAENDCPFPVPREQKVQVTSPPPDVLTP